jgi:hypothetical protein
MGVLAGGLILACKRDMFFVIGCRKFIVQNISVWTHRSVINEKMAVQCSAVPGAYSSEYAIQRHFF